MFKKVILVLVFLVICSSANAGFICKRTKPIAQYQCLKISEPIRVDGILDELAWQKAASTGPLLLWDGKRKTKNQTKAKLLWDDRYLYVGFSCADEDVWTTMTQYDQNLWEAEVVEVFIDPNSDAKQYYEIEVNPLNAIWDGLVTKLSPPKWISSDATWTCKGLKTAVSINGTVNNPHDKDTGWTVEMAIPFDQLTEAPNIPPQPGDKWRLNLYRIERPFYTIEFIAWSATLTPYPDFHVPTRFGEITFIE